MMDEAIATPGSIQQAVSNPGGQLKKAINLTPFSQDPNFNGNWDEFTSGTKEDARRPGPARCTQRRRHHLRWPRRRLAARRLRPRRDLRRRGARRRLHPGVRQHDAARCRTQRLRAAVQPCRRAALPPGRSGRLALRPHQARRRVRAVRRIRSAATRLAQRRRHGEQDRRRRARLVPQLLDAGGHVRAGRHQPEAGWPAGVGAGRRHGATATTASSATPATTGWSAAPAATMSTAASATT